MQKEKHLILSIVPTTHCKRQCSYCYLGPLRNMEAIMSEQDLDNFIKELQVHNYVIDHVQIYGGDLDEERLQKIMPCFYDNVAYAVKHSSISVTGKFGNNISLNIERSDYKENLEHIKNHKDISVMVVVLPKTLKKGPKELLKVLGSANGWRGQLNVFQYQPSAMADEVYNITNKQYCDFMITLIDEYLKNSYEFELAIIKDLEDNRVGKLEGVFGSHLFLFPNKLYADARYDENGLEYFETYRTIEKWEESVKNQKLHVRQECTICEYSDKCLAEHYKSWKDNDICCGLIPLIQWWEMNRGRLNS